MNLLKIKPNYKKKISKERSKTLLLKEQLVLYILFLILFIIKLLYSFFFQKPLVFPLKQQIFIFVFKCYLVEVIIPVQHIF